MPYAVFPREPDCASPSGMLHFSRPSGRILTRGGTFLRLLCSLLLCAALLLCAPALAEDAPGDYLYRLSGEEAVLTGYRGEAGKIDIPGTLDGHPVGVIGRNAFRGARLDTITLPDSIHTVEASAFAGCTAFRIILGNGITSIGERAFMMCPFLESVVFPPSLRHLGRDAYALCPQLRYVVIPASLQEMEGNPFRSCSLLRHFALPADHPRYGVRAGMLADLADARLICCPAGLEETEIAVPEGIRALGELSFSGCRLSSLLLPEGLEEIGSRAFAGCTALSGITLPASLERLDSRALEGSGVRILPPAPEGGSLETPAPAP